MANEIRQAEISRKTGETEIIIRLSLDGNGQHQINTGIPFLDHMLSLLAVHSLCDLTVSATGDLAVDDHHTVEDIGIALGQAINQALGEKRGIVRYGSALIPMDESLVQAALDISGRPYLMYQVPLGNNAIGGLSLENVAEFFQALANNAAMNLHIELIRGANNHHIAEAVFKAFARAFKDAVSLEPRMQDVVWSSKGSL